MRARSGRRSPVGVRAKSARTQRRVSNSTVASSEVRQRILIVAERIFAERGFDAASLRDITEEAGVNIAAVNYYFSSKEELIREILDFRAAPYIAARNDSLDQYLRSLQGATPSVAGVAEALIRPMTIHSRDERGGRALVRLLLHARARPSNETMRVFENRFDPTAQRFIEAFHAAVPGLDLASIYWRYNFSLGAVMQVLADADPASQRLKRLSKGLCDTDSDEDIIRALVCFVAAGFRAESQPLTSLTGREVGSPEQSDRAAKKRRRRSP